MSEQHCLFLRTMPCNFDVHELILLNLFITIQITLQRIGAGPRVRSKLITMSKDKSDRKRLKAVSSESDVLSLLNSGNDNEVAPPTEQRGVTEQTDLHTRKSI